MNEFVIIDNESEGGADAALFNLSFRTSQTFSDLYADTSPQLADEMEFQIEQSFALQAAHCQNHAPAIFYIDGAGKARLVEGCCDSWECKRCGQIRARHEYTRIVSGADTLAKEGHDLYFWTFTCRGKEMPLNVAERDYQKWCNRLLTAARAKCTRQTKRHDPEFWSYAAVTERQTRMHPHTHMLCTYCPSDATPVQKGERTPLGRLMSHDIMWSEWLRREVVKVGLGSECEISIVKSVMGAANYVSKYLFKDMIAEKWPKGWRRVRFAQSFPKLKTDHNPTAIPLVKHADWLKLEALAPLVFADSEYTFERALAHGVYNVIPPRG